jgi:hypothetical protein
VKRVEAARLSGVARHAPSHAFASSSIAEVDPDARTLAGFQLENGQWLRVAALKDDDAVSVVPFDAISFKLGALRA